MNRERKKMLMVVLALIAFAIASGWKTFGGGKKDAPWVRVWP